MGLDIDKTQEELNKKIAQTIDSPLSEGPAISEGGLNAIENQNLKNELSGEVITPGFSAQEAEALTDGLSGETLSPEDSIVLSKPNETETFDNISDNTIKNIESQNIETEVNNTETEKTVTESSDIKENNTILQNLSFTDAALKDYFSKLSLGDFRLNISSLQTIEQLNIVRLVIDEMNFSKAEKLMLLNECVKQQGIIQTMQTSAYEKKTNDGNNITSSETESNDEKVRSRIAFELYTLCKTPAERDLAKFIINNKKLYIFDENNNFVLKKLFEKQMKEGEIKDCKEFLKYITTEPIFESDKDTLNEQTVQCIKEVPSQDNIKERNSLLKDYLSNEQTDKDLFLALFKNCKNENDIKNVQEIINCNKNKDENKIQEKKHNYIQDYLTIYSYLKNSQNENIFAFTDLLAKILINREFTLNKAMFEFFKRLVNEKEIKPQNIQIISNLTEEYNKDNQKEKDKPEKFCKVCEKIHKSGNFAVVIKDFLEDENQNKKYTNPEHEAVVTLVKKDKEIYSDFTIGRAYTDENLQNLFGHAQVDYKKDLLKTLCKTSSFSADNIITIMDNTPFYAVNLTKRILNSKNLTAQQKTDIIRVINTNREITSTVEKTLNENNLDMSTLPKILDPTKIHELEKKDREEEFDDKDKNKVI